MSHELRTPLNAVLGFSEIMTNEVFGPLGSGYGAYARDIHASGRILLKSAEDALAITALLTAPDCKGRQTSRLTSVIDEACAFAAPDLAARSIPLVRDVGDFDILGDHQAMRQLLINLLGEAVRSSAADATLRIEAKSRPGAIDVSLAIQSDRCGLTRDDGFGMILARTLSELSGAELASSAADGECKWTVRLLPAAQHDLFMAVAA
jgi:two-component system cell cycle sensor histidine kinase PleC